MSRSDDLSRNVRFENDFALTLPHIIEPVIGHIDMIPQKCVQKYLQVIAHFNKQQQQ